MRERWKRCSANSFYEVSSFGRARRAVPGKNTFVGKLLRPGIGSNGYPLVALHFGKGVAKSFAVHLLVAREFLGSCPKGKEVNHKDTNKRNPKLSNLEYTTSSGNKFHAVRMGVMPSGEKHYQAKLTRKIVSYIKRSKEQGKLLAERFNVSQQSVCDIRKGRTWK